MKKFFLKLLWLAALVGGVAFVLSAVFDREDPEEEARRAEAEGLEGVFNRAVDGARSVIRREADEAMASMKEAARAKADELKRRASDRAEELKEETKAAIMAKAQELTEEAKTAAKEKARELADDLTRSVENSSDEGLEKLGEGIKERVRAVTESFSESAVTQWESEAFQDTMEALKGGRFQEALENLNQLKQPDVSSDRGAQYDAMIDDVAAFAAKQDAE